MNNKVLYYDSTNKSYSMYDPCFDIPLYDLGFTIGYIDKDNEYTEATIEQISTDTRIIDGHYITQIVYTLDNGDAVEESDIDYYYTDAEEAG